MLPDPWSTPAQYPSSPLYQSAAADQGNIFQTLMNRGRERAAQAGPKVRAGMEQASKMPLGRYATLGAAGLGAATTAAGGDLLGGAGELIGGLGGGALGSAAAGGILKAAGAAIPPAGPIGLGLKVGLPLLGTMLGGGIGKTVAGGTGQAAQQSASESSGPDVSVAGVPLTQAARERQLRERDRAQQLEDIRQIGGAELALSKELYNFMATKEIEQQKAMAPIIERAQRSQLTNAQAMLASQTAAYQQLGRSAMMGKMAAIGQQERGATMRQALASNPYAGAIMQAPQISFG